MFHSVAFSVTRVVLSKSINKSNITRSVWTMQVTSCLWVMSGHGLICFSVNWKQMLERCQGMGGVNWVNLAWGEKQIQTEQCSQSVVWPCSGECWVTVLRCSCSQCQHHWLWGERSRSRLRLYLGRFFLLKDTFRKVYSSHVDTTYLLIYWLFL